MFIANITLQKVENDSNPKVCLFVVVFCCCCFFIAGGGAFRFFSM